MNNIGHHIQDAVITIVPGLAGVYAAAEASNVGLKIVASILTIVWLCFRIAIAIKEYKKK